MLEIGGEGGEASEGEEGEERAGSGGTCAWHPQWLLSSRATLWLWAEEKWIPADRDGGGREGGRREDVEEERDGGEGRGSGADGRMIRGADV